MSIRHHAIQSNDFMLVTTVIKNRRPIFADVINAREAIDVLYRVQELHPFFLHGFVFMPDHIHLLLTIPPSNDISKLMNRFKMGVSHSIGLGPIWQHRFHMTVPRSPKAALRYIYMNPKRAGLIDDPMDYPWSSASGRWDITPIE
jgi:putative transposase